MPATTRSTPHDPSGQHVSNAVVYAGIGFLLSAFWIEVLRMVV